MTVPRRPIGNLVRTTFAAYGRAFPGFVALTGAVYAIAAIVLVPAYLALADLMGPVYDKLPDPFAPTATQVDAYLAALRATAPAMFGLTALISVVSAIASPLAIAATVAATPEAAQGGPVVPPLAVARVRKALPALLGVVGIVVVLGTAPSVLTLLPQALDPAGTFPIAGRVGPSLALTALTSLIGLALIVVLVFLYVRWFVALPAVLVEGSGLRAGLARSAALTRGSRWYVLGALIVLFLGQLALTLVVIIAASVLGAALGAAPASDGNMVSSLARLGAFTGITGLLLSALYTPVFGIAMAILLGDLAWRAEALAAAQASALASAQAPAGSAPPG